MRSTLTSRAASAYENPSLTRHRNRACLGVLCSFRYVLRTYPIMFAKLIKL
jgi:hypothetical protein